MIFDVNNFGVKNFDHILLSGKRYALVSPPYDENVQIYDRPQGKIKGKIGKALLKATCDNTCKIKINGQLVASSSHWQNEVISKDVSKTHVCVDMSHNFAEEYSLPSAKKVTNLGMRVLFIVF